MAVAQSDGAFASHEEGWVFESQLRWTYMTCKTGSDSSAAKRSATVSRVSRVLEDDNYKLMAHVTVGLARKRSLTAQWS